MTKQLNKKTADLAVRTMSGVSIVLLTLFLIYMGRPFFAGFVVILGAMSMYEWTRMLLPKPRAGIYGLSTILAAAVIALVTVSNSINFMIYAVIGAALLLLVFMRFREFQEETGKVAGGFFYIIFSLSLLNLLVMYQGKMVPGPFGDQVFQPFDMNALKVIVAFVFVTVWSSDSLAYVFGRFIGGPKLAPKISPKKTWAGLIGSMTGAALAVVGGAKWLENSHDLMLSTLPKLVLFGAFLGIIGQIGDLMISRFKRKHNVKDMGALIPGHGGVLDRIDALLLIIPFYVYAVFWAL